MRSKSNLAGVKPTFADGPSSFLSNLSAKPKARADSQLKGSSAAEIQRVKTELLNQIQAITNKQDMSGRQLDSRFSQLQQDLRPKVANLEKQQTSTQKQLDDARQRVQKIITDDFSPLQNQYDQIGVKFERFIRYEVESKLKPMQDDLRLSKNKADELLTTANSSVKRLNESVRELQEKINKTTLDIQNQQSNISFNIEDLQPKVSVLEQQLRQIQDTIGNPVEGEVSSPEVVEKSIKKLSVAIDRIEMELLPKLLEESNSQFIDAIKQIGGYCEDKVTELQNDLSVISKSSEEIEAQRKGTEESLDSLTKNSFEMQSRISKLDQNTKSRLLELEQNMNKTLSNLKSQIIDFQTEGDTGSSKIQDQASDDIASLKNQISKAVHDVKEIIKSNNSENQITQQEAKNKICDIKNQIEDNIVAKLRTMEDNIQKCINTINEVNAKRSERYSKYGSRSDIIKRIEQVENRLDLAEQRLKKRDNASGVGPVELGKPKVEEIRPVPDAFKQNEESTSPTVKSKGKKMPKVKDNKNDGKKDENENENEDDKKDKKENDENEDDKKENDDDSDNENDDGDNNNNGSDNDSDGDSDNESDDDDTKNKQNNKDKNNKEDGKGAAESMLSNNINLLGKKKETA